MNLSPFAIEAGASWISPRFCRDEVNRYFDVRQVFELPAGAEPSRCASMQICAETNYEVWLNGRFLGSGQFTDFPDARTFSTLDAGPALREGENVLAVRVHYDGGGHFSYLPDSARLCYVLQGPDVTVVSGEGSLLRPSPPYRQGPMARVTRQLGFAFDFDGVAEDDWREAGYSPAEPWRAPAPDELQAVGEEDAPEQRPVPLLRCRGRCEARIVAQGVFRDAAQAQAGDLAAMAENLQRAYLSARRASETFQDARFEPTSLETGPVTFREDLLAAGDDGAYVVVDLGGERVGWIDLELELPCGASGLEVHIAHGEHLDDLRVRAAVGGRNFFSRCRPGPGRTRFVHRLTRIAGRYLQLHLRGSAGGATLHYAGLEEVELPLKRELEFSCGDSLHEAIRQTGLDTLKLCMHEHYEDCPWREQALYANDSRNQALCGYYGFGEYAFPLASFALLGRSLGEDGFLELCAPMRFERTIPAFSMAWVLCLADHLRYSGQREPARRWAPQAVRMVQAWLDARVDGVMPSPTGGRFWHFYDWAEGLSGTGEGCTSFGELEDMRFDAPLNLYLLMACEAAAELAAVADAEQIAGQLREQARRLRHAIEVKFWDASAGLYATYLAPEGTRSHHGELTQALAICARAGTPEKLSALRQRLLEEDPRLVPTTLSQSLYTFEALCSGGPRERGAVFERIRRDWGGMLFAGATSFWETQRGGWDFDCAGSCCHGWSAVPVYFYGSWLLGVRPESPGFARFRVDPAVGSVDRAAGSIPTPHGEIEVRLHQQRGKLLGEVVHPAACAPVRDAEAEGVELVFRKR